MSSISSYTLQISENNILFTTREVKTGIKASLAINLIITACAIVTIGLCYRFLTHGTPFSPIKQWCFKASIAGGSVLAVFTLLISARFYKFRAEVSELENYLLSIKQKNMDVGTLNPDEKKKLQAHLENLLNCVKSNLKSLKAVPLVGVKTPQFKEFTAIQEIILKDLEGIRKLPI